MIQPHTCGPSEPAELLALAFPKPTRPEKKEPWRRQKFSKQRTSALSAIRKSLHVSYRDLVKKANDLWRHLIYRKEPSKLCPMCRKRRWHDAAHCFAKGPHPGMRFELDNGAPLCRVCHRRVDSDHHAKEEFFMRYIGTARYERLKLMAQGRPKMDVRLVILYLESETAKAG
jgi:hypothetical protein